MLLRTIILAAALPGGLSAQEDPKDPEVRERLERVDLTRMQGEWSVQSWTDAGEELPEAKAKERTLTIGSQVLAWRHGDSVWHFGVLKLDPTKSPKAVNLNVVAGEHQGTELLGIYRYTVATKTLELCFDTTSDARPDSFETKDQPKRFSVTCVKRPAEGKFPGDIAGEYNSQATALGGPDVEGKAVIQRLGESYLVRYSHQGRLAYLGVGVRSGDVLSVSWSSPDRKEIGLSVYLIEKNGTMRGRYSKLGGAGILNGETLTPAPIIE